MTINLKPAAQSDVNRMRVLHQQLLAEGWHPNNAFDRVAYLNGHVCADLVLMACGRQFDADALRRYGHVERV